MRWFIGALFLITVTMLAGCASGERPMQLLSGTGAVYPPDARDEGIEGYVVVRYDVDAQGRVREPRVVEASPTGVFEDSALQAVSRWRFQAPTRDGEPQPVEGLESRLEFALEDAEAYQGL